jgi:hypothetical protein
LRVAYFEGGAQAITLSHAPCGSAITAKRPMPGMSAGALT